MYAAINRRIWFMPLILIMGNLAFAQQLKIQSKVKLLALGDSYTIGQSVPATDRWPAQLIDSLKTRGLDCYDPHIIATTGWTTSDLKAAIDNAGLRNEYNLVSLLIGVNNYYQGGSTASYAPQFRDLLENAIALAKGKASNVFVLSIPDYGYTPFGENMQSVISAGIARFNFTNDSITKLYNVPRFNITPISQQGIAQPDYVASDRLHPSGRQYAQWVKLILAGALFNTDPSDTSGTVTGIKQNHALMSYYPNPFHNDLTIGVEGEAHDSGTLRLFNQLGQLAIEETLAAGGKTRLATSALPAGFYVIHFLTDDGQLRLAKVLKE